MQGWLAIVRRAINKLTCFIYACCNLPKCNQVSDKKSFVLRMDSEMYKALEKWAADEFRSVNGQLEFLIDQALREAGRKKTTDKKPAEKKK